MKKIQKLDNKLVPQAFPAASELGSEMPLLVKEFWLEIAINGKGQGTLWLLFSKGFLTKEDLKLNSTQGNYTYYWFGNYCQPQSPADGTGQNQNEVRRYFPTTNYKPSGRKDELRLTYCSFLSLISCGEREIDVQKENTNPGNHPTAPTPPLIYQLANVMPLAYTGRVRARTLNKIWDYNILMMLNSFW